MGTGTKLDVLRGVRLFSTCTEHDLARVASLLTETVVAAGEILVEEGAPGRRMLIVAEGTGAVSQGGRRLGSIGPGAVIGEMSLLDQHTRTATVTAESPMRVWSLDPRGFTALLDQIPAVSRALLRGLAGRVRTDESEELP